jgi:hypothetical protein
MKTNPLKQGAIIINMEAIGTVCPDMVFRRATELRLIYGNTSISVSREECNLARHELTGESEDEDIDFVIESAPESSRWDPVHGSDGSMAWKAPSEDEDEEGHSDSARLVEEGIREAEHDLMLQAARIYRM